MKTMLMVVFSMVCVVSTVKAGSDGVAFDGGSNSRINLSPQVDALPAPSAPIRVRQWDDEELPGGNEQNVFIKGTKCQGSDCVNVAFASYCNTKTCGKAASKSTAAPALDGLAPLISGMPEEATRKFYGSLMFSESGLSSIYVKDIEEHLGQERLSEVLGYFNLKTPGAKRQNENGTDSNGDGVIDSDYVKGHRCDGHHNCVPQSGYNCTDNC